MGGVHRPFAIVGFDVARRDQVADVRTKIRIALRQTTVCWLGNYLKGAAVPLGRAGAEAVTLRREGAVRGSCRRGLVLQVMQIP